MSNESNNIEPNYFNREISEEIGRIFVEIFLNTEPEITETNVLVVDSCDNEQRGDGESW